MPMWTRDEAILLISQIQPKLVKLNYHICLGGSVLNDGLSNNDLDLFLLPIYENEDFEYTKIELLLEQFLGKYQIQEEYNSSSPSCFFSIKKYYPDNKQIDIFIIKG